MQAQDSDLTAIWGGSANGATYIVGFLIELVSGFLSDASVIVE